MNSRNPGRINLKHLHYFHEVAREGSLTAAARRLHLAPQTLSSQVRELETSLGRKLLERAGRRLVLTADGEVARDYFIARAPSSALLWIFRARGGGWYLHGLFA